MKSGWEYTEENGVREKLAPTTLAANVLMSENGPALMDAIRDLVHPVGSVWISVENTDPNLAFGGTWVQIEDVFLLAAGSTFSLGMTGGEIEHTLSQQELPRVSGTIVAGSGSAGEYGNGYGAFRYTSGVFTAANDRQYAKADNQYASAWPQGDNRLGKERVNMTFGEDEPHNNMPPYITVNVWKRIA